MLFAVWAPNATRVSVVGEFNRWDGRRSQMRRRFDSGLWEIFVPQLTVGAIYKFELLGPNGELLPLKADPFGLEAELRPSTASVVSDSADFTWTDAEYMAKRREGEPRRKPMSIYEAHLGSWRRSEGGRFLTYDELAEQPELRATARASTTPTSIPISRRASSPYRQQQPVADPYHVAVASFGRARGAARVSSREAVPGRRWAILIHGKKLSSLQLLPILEAAVQTAKPLLLVAEDIERRRHRSGGGAALLRAQAAVGKLKDDNPDIQAGINIVLRALEAPSHHTPRSTTSAASRNAGTDGCGP